VVKRDGVEETRNKEMNDRKRRESRIWDPNPSSLKILGHQKKGVKCAGECRLWTSQCKVAVPVPVTSSMARAGKPDADRESRIRGRGKGQNPLSSVVVAARFRASALEVPTGTGR